MIKVTVKYPHRDPIVMEVKRLQKLDFRPAILATLKGIYNRGKAPGGTPVRTGQLRQSLGFTGDEVGYTKEYAPDVEFGHVTKTGKAVRAQRYLQKNCAQERPLFRKRIEDTIKGK